MTDGFVLSRESGRRIRGSGMILKVGADQSKHWSAFEVQVPPGFDVGAHLHRDAEELFYILEGELELLAFEPRVRTKDNWRAWESKTGAKVVRGGAGSAMFVPSGCPHAFANPGTAAARMLFLVAPPGHEHYQDEIGELLSQGGPPDPAAIAKLRARYDIEQLTPLNPGRGVPPPGRPPAASLS
jgi:quercetin dioxygenase-like cupin family protein